MSERDLAYYMSLPYRVVVYPEEDDGGYTAVIPELPGCMTCADTYEDLWPLLEEAKELWLEVALADGDYIPEPAPVEVEVYSGKFVVRLPRSLHRQLAERAKQEDTSLNQLVVMLLSEGMGRWAERSQAFRPQYGEYRGVSKPFTHSGFQSLECSVAQWEVSDQASLTGPWWTSPHSVFGYKSLKLDMFGHLGESDAL